MLRSSLLPYSSYPNASPLSTFIQNALPSGPTSWFVSEVADRMLRWADDGYMTLKGKGLNKWCNMRIQVWKRCTMYIRCGDPSVPPNLYHP